MKLHAAFYGVAAIPVSSKPAFYEDHDGFD